MKIDARKRTPEVQQEKRDIAIKLRKKGRMSNNEIAEIVVVHRTTISQWHSKYKRDRSAIVIKKRGRRLGEVRRLIP